MLLLLELLGIGRRIRGFGIISKLVKEWALLIMD